MNLRLVSPLSLGILAMVGGMAAGVGTYALRAGSMVTRAAVVRNKAIAELRLREQHLAIEQQELDKVRADIESMHQQMEQRITMISADESKNLRSLAQTYTNLSPKGAVAIFREMDDATAVKILSLMKPDVVGPIFEEMANGTSGDPTLARRAAVLSDKLRLLRAAPPST